MGGELEGWKREVGRTNGERKLSGDRSWITKNRPVVERLWGRRNVNHGRGVLSRRLRS